MGILTKGMGVIMKRFSKPKKVTKSTVDLSDDGGPYVRKQQHNAKKAKKERSAESIKKYQGIK